MDSAFIIDVIGAVSGLLGVGGLGGTIVYWRRIASEIRRENIRNREEIRRAEELNRVRIEQSKAETALLVERARADLITDLQDERDKCAEKLDACHKNILLLEETCNQWRQRCTTLELLLVDNHIPLPY